MPLFACFNNKVLPNSAINLPAVSSAALYGRGIFTTLAVYRGQPFLWDSHEKRLRENAAHLEIELSQTSFDAIQNSLLELIKINRIDNGRARITLFDGRSSQLWQSENESETFVLITNGEQRGKLNERLNLTVSPFRVNSTGSLTGIKSCNYLENILSLASANKQNFDEAVRLNERGEVVSAIMANLFWISGEQIFTPNLQTGALRGTTREFTVNLLKQLGLVVEEKTISLSDLKTAHEIFLTSAGLGVCLVKSLDSQILSDKISSKIKAAFSEIINS